MGFDKVYPALRSAPKNSKHAVGLRGAENCWNYVVASLIIACGFSVNEVEVYSGADLNLALMNWQYSKTGGPVSREDIGIFWTIIGMHGINGFRYAQVGAYETLLPMWIAPLLSVAAYWKA